MLRGAAVTIAVAVAAMLSGFVVGIVCGLIKGARPPADYSSTATPRWCAECQNYHLPLFFSMVEFVTKVATAFGYAGLADAGYAFIIAVIAIGAISGAYSTEVVRGALASIPQGHIEAARALGLPGLRIFRRIIAPQMLRIAVPGMNNVWQTTIKDTALVSVVGLQELMRTAFIGSGTTRHPFIFYLIAAAVYLAITLVSQFGIDQVERGLRLRGRK